MEKYIESHLPESFAEEIHRKSKELIDKGQSFSIIGMPAVGVSPFLRFLASKPYAHFIYLDCYELSTFTKEALLLLFYKKLTGKIKSEITFQDCKTILQQQIKNGERVVIIINKFDLLENDFSENFFSQFRTLTHGTEGKVSCIFSVTKQYIAYNFKAIAGTNMYLFSRYLYFPPYKKEDIKDIMIIHSPELVTHPRIDHAFSLSGNHIQLLQLILRSNTPNNLLHDPYITVLFEEILKQFTKIQHKQLIAIALKKQVDIDYFLIHMGVIRKEKDSYQLFSPLFAEYLRKGKSHRLSLKERKLFQLLKTNQGKIISKKKITEAVWEESEGITDWAIDSLIYRLRNTSYIKDKGYIILNHKKLGYQLIKE